MTHPAPPPHLQDAVVTPGLGSFTKVLGWSPILVALLIKPEETGAQLAACLAALVFLISWLEFVKLRRLNVIQPFPNPMLLGNVILYAVVAVIIEFPPDHYKGWHVVGLLAGTGIIAFLSALMGVPFTSFYVVRGSRYPATITEEHARGPPHLKAMYGVTYLWFFVFSLMALSCAYAAHVQNLGCSINLTIFSLWIPNIVFWLMVVKQKDVESIIKMVEKHKFRECMDVLIAAAETQQSGAEVSAPDVPVTTQREQTLVRQTTASDGVTNPMNSPAATTHNDAILEIEPDGLVVAE